MSVFLSNFIFWGLVSFVCSIARSHDIVPTPEEKFYDPNVDPHWDFEPIE